MAALARLAGHGDGLPGLECPFRGDGHRQAGRRVRRRANDRRGVVLADGPEEPADRPFMWVNAGGAGDLAATARPVQGEIRVDWPGLVQATTIVARAPEASWSRMVRASSMSPASSPWRASRTRLAAACTDTTSPPTVRARSMWWLPRSSRFPPPARRSMNQGRLIVGPMLVPTISPICWPWSSSRRSSSRSMACHWKPIAQTVPERSADARIADASSPVRAIGFSR